MVQPGLLPVPGQPWPNQLLLQLQRVGAVIAQFLQILQAQEVPTAKGFVFLPASEAAYASNLLPLILLFFNFTG